MRRVLDAITSRATAIGLMAFIAVAGVIGAEVPQRAAVGSDQWAAWQTANPRLAAVVVAAGLDHIFSVWWFVTVLGVFGISLAIATTRMCRTAWRALRRTTDIPLHTLRADLPIAEVCERAVEAGYREKATDGDRRVFVRHAIGYWAPAVMHGGMLLALVAAAVASAFSSRALLDLTQGEVWEPGDAYYATDTGVFGSVPELGKMIRFDAMDVATWDNGELESVTARLSLGDENDEWVAAVSSVNTPLRLGGYTLYVRPDQFGDAALVLVTTPEGVTTPMRISFPFAGSGAVSYTSVYLDGQVVLDARWDPSGVRAANPLAFRPPGDDASVPVTLAQGDVVSVNDLTVEYVSDAQWARFIIVKPHAIGVLFLGFAIIGLGALMLYLWIPRMLVVEPAEGGVRYQWRSARMGRAYLLERDFILGDAQTKGDR
jgi:cytochrome c biogenesis protein ResB